MEKEALARLRAAARELDVLLPLQRRRVQRAATELVDEERLRRRAQAELQAQARIEPLFDPAGLQQESPLRRDLAEVEERLAALAAQAPTVARHK